MSECIATQYYQHETHVEGGWGNASPGSDTMRIFFGTTKRCKCPKCTKQYADELWEHMQRRRMVSGGE